MTETDKTETGTKAPRRSHEAIAADYAERAAKAGRKAKLANTKGLKSLNRAAVALYDALKEAEGTSIEAEIGTLAVHVDELLERLEA